MSRNIEVGALLVKLRAEAKITQATIAAAMGVSQSQVSRLEAGSDAFTPEDHLAYLAHIPGEAAEQARVLLTAEWIHLTRPALQHPDIARLLAAEISLQNLAAFLARDDAPKALAGQAEMLWRRIHDFAEYLRSLKHKIAWVGDIGVGKTTAACRQAGLVANPQSAADLRGVLLDTGGGRVTLCEVEVGVGATYQVRVEPMSDEEVYRLVADFGRALWDIKDLAPDAPPPMVDYRPATEVERALRNLSGLIRPPRRKGEVAVDPAVELMKTCASLEDFTAEIASRLTLWRRTARLVAFEGGDDAAGRQWLKETFAAINNGRHPDFTLPARIHVSVPFSMFADTPYEVEMIDTRGVDGSAVRPDIVAQLKGPRTVTVLCSRFNSAPDVSLDGLLRHMVDTEVDAALPSRALVLVLSRTGEALAMRDEGGEPAYDVDEGYEIKRSHVEDALTKIGAAGVEVAFFDSANDDALALTQTLGHKITALREGQAQALTASIAAVEQMLANVARAQALLALETVNWEMTLFAERHQELGRPQITVYSRLIAALRDYHARTVWAATRRQGAFWNFDVYQHLGAGAAAAVKRRAEPAVLGLREILANKLADPEMASAHSFIEQILADVGRWEADFVEAARHHAVTVYRAALMGDEALWSGVEAQYGYGRPDYRGTVARAVQTWFENQDELAAKLERRLQKAWRQAFLKPLRNTAGERLASEA